MAAPDRFEHKGFRPLPLWPVVVWDSRGHGRPPGPELADRGADDAAQAILAQPRNGEEVETAERPELDEDARPGPLDAQLAEAGQRGTPGCPPGTEATAGCEGQVGRDAGGGERLAASVSLADLGQ